MQLLGEAAGLGPVAARADPEPLLPLAYALASEVYPDLLRQEVNRMPAWLTWLVGFPRYTPAPARLLDCAAPPQADASCCWGTTLIPLALLAVNVVALLIDGVPDWCAALLAACCCLRRAAAGRRWRGCCSCSACWSRGRQRRQARWRKQLAALLRRVPLRPGCPGGAARR